jgi:hypothetical protein
MSPAERLSRNHHYETPVVRENPSQGGATSIETTFGSPGSLDITPTAAEVPHLEELAEKAIPAVRARAVGMHTIHAATTSSSEHHRSHAA